MRYIRDEPESCNLYRVDLRDVDYLDSSALGMLLILKEHAERNHSNVVLCCPSTPAKKLLDFAGFDLLFDCCDHIDLSSADARGAASYNM